MTWTQRVQSYFYNEITAVWDLGIMLQEVPASSLHSGRKHNLFKAAHSDLFTPDDQI